MLRRSALPLAPLLLLTLALAPRLALAENMGGEAFFETKVRPVLAEHCYQCHSATAPKLKAGLRLDHADGIFKGAEANSPGVVVPGNVDDSLLISALHYEQDGL